MISFTSPIALPAGKQLPIAVELGVGWTVEPGREMTGH